MNGKCHLRDAKEKSIRYAPTAHVVGRAVGAVLVLFFSQLVYLSLDDKRRSGCIGDGEVVGLRGERRRPAATKSTINSGKSCFGCLNKCAFLSPQCIIDMLIQSTSRRDRCNRIVCTARQYARCGGEYLDVRNLAGHCVAGRKKMVRKAHAKEEEKKRTKATVKKKAARQLWCSVTLACTVHKHVAECVRVPGNECAASQVGRQQARTELIDIHLSKCSIDSYYAQ